MDLTDGDYDDTSLYQEDHQFAAVTQDYDGLDEGEAEAGTSIEESLEGAIEAEKEGETHVKVKEEEEEEDDDETDEEESDQEEVGEEDFRRARVSSYL